MSAKSWNKAFGLNPDKTKVPEGKNKLTARRNDLYYIVISPDKGAFIWDEVPANYVHRGYVLVKQPRGYEIYQVWAHPSFYADAQVQQRMAEFFPTVSDMEII